MPETLIIEMKEAQNNCKNSGGNQDESVPSPLVEIFAVEHNDPLNQLAGYFFRFNKINPHSFSRW